jgi:hypothetical protein
MDCSLDEALTHLRQWYSESATIRVAFVGRGMKLSYTLGSISNMSGTEFTFVAPSVRAVFDLGVNSKAQLIPLGGSESVPPEIKEFSEKGDVFVLVFTGVLGDILAILKERD